MSDNKDIGWMYHGAKSEVNREDYLLGKRIDKNFEKYSDAVIEQKPDAIETVTKARTVNRTSSSDHKVSALQKNIIKSEDPLVAVKVKEELRKQEMMENPVLRMKFQKILKDMMEKKEKKKHKKDKKSKKKKKKKHHSSDDDTSSDEEKTLVKEKVDSKSDSRKRERSPSPERSHNQPPIDRHRVKSDDRTHSPIRNRNANDRRHYSPEQTRRRPPYGKNFSAEKRQRDTSDKRKHESPVRRERRRSPLEYKRHQKRSPSPRRRRSRSSSDDRLWKKRKESSSPEMRKKRHDSESPSPKREGSANKRSSPIRRSRSPSRKRRHDSSSPSPERRRSPKRKQRDSPRSSREKRVQQEDTSVGNKDISHQSDESVSNSPDQERNFDSHIPAHLRTQAPTTSDEDEAKPPAYYDREDKERKKKYEGYGLVTVKEKSKRVDDKEKGDNPYKLTKLPPANLPVKRDKRKPLTEEEKAAKLREMQENAEWRDNIRYKNLKKATEDNEKEEEEEREKKAPSFIRAQLNTATADLSIEQRLHSNTKKQRSHGYMERKFTTR